MCNFDLKWLKLNILPYIQQVMETPNKSFQGLLVIQALLAIVKGGLLKSINSPSYMYVEYTPRNPLFAILW